MSSSNQRSTRRTRQTPAATSSNTEALTTSSSRLTTTATNRNGRVSVRAVASDRKTYFVDSSDEDDIKVTKTVASPNKKSKLTNGM